MASVAAVCPAFILQSFRRATAAPQPELSPRLAARHLSPPHLRNGQCIPALQVRFRQGAGNQKESGKSSGQGGVIHTAIADLNETVGQDSVEINGGLYDPPPAKLNNPFVRQGIGTTLSKVSVSIPLIFCFNRRPYSEGHQ
ncbi:hypothetical protein KDW10_22170 [Burkholderia vietnamiensis]|uniref:hypothetical protein n=1 Tax=Burkholderia vietnamiensis TaxID=60552 RepID=UPI001BA240B1|nr:hypothetical protein [Burkholderia vietnamiensis]MBR8360043.1 hypothetical protein [Burkholderia vietnamiensis]